MNNKVKKWINLDGITFLKKIGIKKGDNVIDFGCGSGHYSIPAAKIVSIEGKVYSIEKDKYTLDKLKQTVEEEGSNKVITIIKQEPSNILKINLADKTADFVLVYDVLHYLTKNERKEIYKEIHRVLKNDGILSVYPKHNKSDWPISNLAEMEVEDVVQEIVEMNFMFKNKKNFKLFHDENYETGNVLAFRKKIWK